MKILKKNHQLLLFLIFFAPLLYSITLKGACTKSIKTTLRKGPGTHFEKLWDITLFSPVKVKKYENQWAKIEDSEGILAWIPKEDITEKYFCGSIKFEKVSIHHKVQNQKNVRKNKTIPRGFAFFDQNFKILKFRKGQVAALSPLGNQVLVPRKSLWVQ